ncbi:glycine-rich cell wall structural protein 1-like [Cocos nucifera]|nr:glycine-rich cell wall structural protein 1-like [Cocos nucifera]
MGNRHGDMATGVSGVGSQGGGVRDIYEWDEGGTSIYRSGARGSRYVGANHGPALGGGGGNVGAIYGSGTGGGGNVGSIYGDVDGRESNVLAIHGRREGGDYRAGGSLRRNIGAIYASGARNTGGNIDEIFLPGPGSGGTVDVGGSWRVR